MESIEIPKNKSYLDTMCTVKNVKGDIEISRLPVDSEEFMIHEWTIKYTKSHILHSICNSVEKCEKPGEECLLCLYTKELDLPNLPEMVFPNNKLILRYNSGIQIEFNALDALKLVSNGKNSVKVACSNAWKETRAPENTMEKLKPFDWTFTTDYKGTISGPAEVYPTEERIDIEKLKQKENILFYQELMLYEDELHDNGIASCTIKIRVMPSSFFVLLRYFLRVDNVMVRINDTRLFHDFNTNFILREYTNKECGMKDLNLPLTMFGDPNMLSPHMPLRTWKYEKIVLHGEHT